MNVIQIQPQLDPTVCSDDAMVSGNLVRSAIARLLSFARAEGMENTAMTLELALTAIAVDYEERCPAN